MKKILLFVSIVFFALYSNKTNAQTIDSVITSQYIECPGGTATLDVYITQSIPALNYSIVLQKLNNQSSGYQHDDVILNTTSTFEQFLNRFQANYRVLLVDPNLPQSSYPTGLGNVLGPNVYSQSEIIVGSPANLNISISDDSLLCWYDTTANLTLYILNGGTPPYTVTMAGFQSVTLPSNISSIDFPNLSAGTYNFTVTDTFNCFSPAENHTITAPDSILIDAEILNEITCFGANDGEISINGITGGSISPAPNYTITMSGPNGVNVIALAAFPIIIDSLTPGIYQLTVVDEYGCDTISDVFTFVDADSISASTTFIDPTCDGFNDGSITITLSSIFQGAGAPFQYTQNGGSNWVTFQDTLVVLNGLPDGIYTNIRVRDVNGCEFNLPADTLTDLDPVTFNLTAFDYNGFQISCNGVCDGVITLNNMLGGAGAPYSIGGITIFVDTIRDSYCGATIANGGINYIDTIEDAIGCLGVNSIDIFEPEVFSISAGTVLLANGYNVSCPSTCDGLINVTPINGVDTINYFVSSLSSFFTSNTFAFGTVSANNICGENTNNGQDTIIAIDANQCVDTAYISLLEPDLFTFDIDSINENCASNNGKAWVSNINGGLPPYNYSWTGPVGTGPFSNNDTIENLSYGQYNVTVTDSMGCDTTLSILVDSSFILVDPITVLVPCNGIDNGEITISTNGVLLSNVVLENLTTSLVIENYNSFYNPPPPAIGGFLVQNPNIDTVMTFGNLTSGQYELRVELYGNIYPSPGCGSVAYPITVGAPFTMDATLDLALSELDLICFGDVTDSIFIDVTDGFTTLQSPFNNTFKSYIIEPLGPQIVIINPGNHNALYNAGVLPAGNYDIVITPAIDTSYVSNGVIITEPRFTNCYDTVSVTVTEPDSLEFILGSVQTLCYGDSTGIIFVDTIFGGNSGEYNYIWRNSLGNIINNSAVIVSDLPAGWYFLTVLDSLNCLPETIDSVEITEPTDITWTANIAAIDSCEYTSSTGAIVLTSTGGMGPHSYIWNGLDANGTPFTSFTPNLSTLTSGTYHITITDTNSCTKNDSVFIDNGTNPSLDSSSFTNVSCFGLNDGSYIGIADSTGTSFPYTFYDFSANSFVPGYIPSDSLLGPVDTIIIRLKDNFGCVDSSFYVITEPDLLKIDSLIVSTFIGGNNVSCNGSFDGQITISGVTGGTPNYSYWLQDTNSLTFPLSIDSVFSALASRYYMAYVIDDHGCLDSSYIYLDQPDSLLIDSFNIHTYIGGNNVSCNGFNDGLANVYVSGGIQTYSYSWSNGDMSDTAYALFADTLYTVVVTDTNGCIYSASISLTQPTPLIINSFNTTQVLCKGGDRGSSTVNVSGSTPIYTYLWDNANNTIPTYINPNDTVPSMNDTSAFADTLRAGWYNVEVWDMNGCYITDSVELTEPVISITIDSLIVTQMTCFTYDNASVDVIATGPQPLPYLYSAYEVSNPLNINNTQGNLGVSSLSAGNYVALVEDNLGCLDRDTFEITHLDSVYIDTVVFNNISCNGFNDGYIYDIVPMGGTAPYLYSINGGDLSSSWICSNPNTCPTGYEFSDLAPGTYDVEIWDANDCANSYEITITQPVQMAVSITTNNYNNYQILCDGLSDEAFVNVSGGWSPYTLGITGGNPISNTSISNASGIFNPLGIFQGVYTFTLTDNNSCTYIETVNFNEPDPITFTPITTDVFCQDSCTGEITAITAGGVGLGNGSNYTYQWSDVNGIIPGEISYNITDRCTGDYTIEATDANGCTGQLFIPIGFSVLDITSSVTSNVTCFEDCDGSITLNVSGGVLASSGATYTYLWNDVLGQTINPAIGLCEGSYTCTVTDIAGCSVTSSSILVTQPAEFIANIILNNAILCYGGGTGDLSITTTGGTNPISSYAWSDGTNGISTTGLAGNYSSFVEDANGCSDTAHYELVEPSDLTILESDIVTYDVKCKGDATGKIYVTASGGTLIPGLPGTYDYELFDMNGISIQIITSVLNAQFTVLSTGNYYVVVTDYNGCIYTTGNIFIDEPDNKLEITIDDYNETCVLLDAKAVVFPTGGTSPYTYLWSDGQTTATATNLDAEDNTSHTVIVTDANDCVESGAITLLGYKYVFLPGNNIDYNDSICLGQPINIQIDDKPGLTYVWTMFNGLEIDTIAMTADLTLQTDSSFSPIEILTLIITDPDCGGSHSVMATVYIDDLDPECSANELTILLDQSVTLSEIGSVNFDTYEWTNTNGEVLSNSSSFTDQPEKSSWYNLYVTNGLCKGYCSVYVTLGVLPYDAISPNGDGMNDEWVIRDLERYPDAIVKVFNRWGQLLFEIDGPSYPNNDFNWEELTVGTYYYIIDLGNGDLPQTGPITIIK